MTAAFVGFGSSRFDGELGHARDHTDRAGRVPDAGGRQEVGELVTALPMMTGFWPLEHVVERLVADEQRAGEHEAHVGVVEHLGAALGAVLFGDDLARDEFAGATAEAAEFGVHVGDGGFDADGVLGEHRLLVDVADLERLAGCLARRGAGVVDAPLVDLLLGEVALRLFDVGPRSVPAVASVSAGASVSVGAAESRRRRRSPPVRRCRRCRRSPAGAAVGRCSVSSSAHAAKTSPTAATAAISLMLDLLT